MDFKKRDEYYYHGLPNYDEDVIISIINNGILSGKYLNNNSSEFIGFNGNNYISVCKRESMDKIDNCYDLYIDGFFSIVIDNIKTIKTNKVLDSEYKYLSSNEYYSNYNDENNDERYSDLEGEYQVKDFIPNSKFVAIGFPLSILRIDMDEEKIINMYSKIKDTLRKNDLDISIVDLEEEIIITDKIFKSNRKILQKKI